MTHFSQIEEHIFKFILLDVSVQCQISSHPLDVVFLIVPSP